MKKEEKERRVKLLQDWLESKETDEKRIREWAREGAEKP